MFERRPFFTTVRHDNISSVRIWDIAAVDIQSHRVSSAELRQACVLSWINLIILFRGNQQSEPENSRGKAGTKRWIEKKRKTKKTASSSPFFWAFSSWIDIAFSRPPHRFFISSSAFPSRKQTYPSMFSRGTSQHCDDIQLWYFTKQILNLARCQRVQSSPSKRWQAFIALKCHTVKHIPAVHIYMQ